MACGVELSPRAWRDLRGLPRSAAQAVLDTLGVLRRPVWPGPPKIKKLKRKDMFRLRVGAYRVVFERMGASQVVIHRIVDRKELERTLGSL